MRRPVTDIALLAYIARKNASVVSYTEATKACKSSSSASRVLHQLIGEGILDPQPKLLGLRYVTQYVVTKKGKQVASLALRLTTLRETAARISRENIDDETESQEKREVTEKPKVDPSPPLSIKQSSDEIGVIRKKATTGRKKQSVKT